MGIHGHQQSELGQCNDSILLRTVKSLKNYGQSRRKTDSKEQSSGKNFPLNHLHFDSYSACAVQVCLPGIFYILDHNVVHHVEFSDIYCCHSAKEWSRLITNHRSHVILLGFAIYFMVCAIWLYLV